MTVRPILVALLVSVCAACPAHAAFPGRNGTLAFTDLSDRDSDRSCDGFTRSDCGARSHLFFAGPAGDGPKLMNEDLCLVSGCDVAAPSWSATGRRLVVEKHVVAREDLIAITDMHGILDSEFDRPPELARISQPAFSPDGRRLAVTGVRLVPSALGESTFTYVSAIYVTNRWGTLFRRVTSGPYDSAPAWSSSGRIAFERGPSHEDPDGNVFTVLPSGKRLRRVTRFGGSAPSWSPHAGRIVFERRGDLFTVRPDGRGVRRLTRSGDDTDPAWSPNGRLIGFVRDDGIFTIRPNGRGARRIVAPKGRTSLSGPEWRPRPR